MTGNDRGNSDKLNELKKEITLTGNDRGNSDKLNELKEVTYSNGDIIRIYRRNLDAISISGDVTGHIPSDDEMTDDNNKFDYMKNTGFEVSNAGLEAIYNKAPVLNGVTTNKTITKGTSLNLLDGINVSDDIDNASISTDNITIRINGQELSEDNRDNYTFENLGTYEIEYIVHDSWGRSTLQEVTITVESKVKENSIEVYGPNQTRAFKVIFDTTQNKFVLTNEDTSTTYNSSSNNEDKYFEMTVRDITGKEKYEVALNGDPAHDIEELKKIHEKGFSKYDTINNKFDYMKNTGFEVSNAGLEAIYNKAPVLNGVTTNKTITKGTSLNLLDGINVSDDIDNASISTDNITIRINGQELSEDNRDNYTFENLGTYEIEYIVHDSWGRSTLQEVTITVESKVKENSIEVYGPNQTRAFKVIFDTTQNKFVLTNEDTSTTYNSSSNNEDKYFEMTVRDITGKEKYEVALNGDPAHDIEELKKIHEKGFSKYDTIALYGKTANAVKIQGNVISSNSTKTNHDYSNGFGTTDKYSEVRFKITDDGFKEMTKKDPTISGLDPKTIKRGDEIDLLDGVVVDVKDTNNEDYKIKVNEKDFNKLKENTYTVTYTVTNSWGSSVEQERTITIKHQLLTVEMKLLVTIKELC